MQIRNGTLQECVDIVQAIPEFAHKETVQSLQARLDKFEHAQVLVAEAQGQLLGFKIGYALDETCYYSWFGGVAPAGRKQGVAQALLEAQEAWVMAQGFSRLKVKSRNRFAAMLRMLLRNGYLIENFEHYPGDLDSRIHFVKQLNKNK